MCEGERACHLQRHFQRLVHRHRSGPFEELLQVLALDVFEDDVLPAGVLAPIDDRDDVRVAQLGDRSGLAPEPLDVLLVCREMRVENLDRDDAVEQTVMRLEDAGHAALADQLEDLEPTGDDLPLHGRNVTDECAQLGG
jgi:hypothetical protein